MESPSAEALASWIEVIAYLAVVIAALAVAWHHLSGASNRRTISPDPLTFKQAQEPAMRGELVDLRTHVDGELHQLHGRISSTRKELTDQIKGLDARIDEIPGRTIRLLNETKNLHS